MYNESIEEIAVGKYTVKIYYDDHGSESPREWCNLGTMFTCERNYNSPDKYQTYSYTSDGGNGMYEAMWEEIFPNIYLEDLWIDMHDSERDKYWDRMNSEAIIMPVYKIDHSGIAYSTSPFSCPWDSGQVGYIFISKSKIRKEYGVKRISPKLKKQVENNLKSEVEIYSSWANGEIYGFSVEDENGESLESCWGFIGEVDYCISEGVDIAKYMVIEDHKIGKRS